MRKLIAVLNLLICLSSFGQFKDSLKVLHYNVLNYRNHFNECTSSTNNISQKEAHLRTILNYVQADLVSFNEIANRQSAADSLNQEVMAHIQGVSYSMAPFSGSSFLANALFYNAEKLVYHSKDVINKDLDGNDLVRLIDAHRLYYNQASALSAGDTTFLIVYQLHLKAGSELDDLDERNKATQSFMAYHQNHHAGHHYLLMGDLNVKSSNEQAYENMTTDASAHLRFIDPIDQQGAWNSNSNFAQIHTQSTRSTSTNDGCFSGGGLDDRFDFILCSKELLDGSSPLQYIPSSYVTLGNDGLHFNKDLLSPANTSEPDSVINALYACSDHLPVIAQLELSSQYSNLEELIKPSVVWHIEGDQLRLLGEGPSFQIAVVTDLLGRPYIHKTLGSSPPTIDISALPKGAYMLQLISDEIRYSYVFVYHP